jgi:hypothetical protein
MYVLATAGHMKASSVFTTGGSGEGEGGHGGDDERLEEGHFVDWVD